MRAALPLPGRRAPAWLVALVVLLAARSGAAASFQTLETEQLRLIYHGPTMGFIAPYAARCFENSMRFHRDLFGWTPGEKVTVILTDIADYSNAAAWASPRNGVLVHLAPTNFVYETGPANERVNFVMNHELGHVVTLDQATPGDRFFRELFFGKVRETDLHPESILFSYLTLPRRSAPKWQREGTATFMETWMSGGLGRAQGPYDEMVFRAMVRDSSHFYDPLGLESEGTKVDFQIGANAYLYGTRFLSWLAWEYGPERFIDWVSRRPGSRAYLASDFRRVYGRSLTDGWRAWIAEEHVFQERNLEAIRRYPTTPYRDLSSRALGSVSRAVLDSASRTLYAGVFYPGAVAHIAAIPLDGGPTRALAEVKGPALYFVTSLAWDPGARRIYYTTDNNDWRDLNVLDPATRRSRRLIKDARIGELVFNRADSTLWGVRHFNGICTIVRLRPPYDDYAQVVSYPYGRIVYDLDLSPDGRWASMSVGEISGRHALRLARVESLLAADTSARTLFDFGNSIPQGFTFSSDGRFLYGSSYYTGASNVFRYDLAADSMDIVTNAETGFFRPIPRGGDSLIVFRFSGRGFVPAAIEAAPLHDVSAITYFGQTLVAKHPVLETWRVPPPSRIPIDSLITREGPYRPLREVRLTQAYPIIEQYKDWTAAGAALVFQDPISRHMLTLSASVTPQPGLDAGERLHLDARYQVSAFDLRARLNPASFYDLFGPTRSARKGRMASVGWSRTLIRDDPRELVVGADLEGWSGLEVLPQAQNVDVSPGFERLVTASLHAKDEYLRSSIGSTDIERGWTWNVSAAENRIRFETATGHDWRDFTSVEGGLDLGTSLPVQNASIWLRSATGWSPGDRDDPFANFFFGAFGNNWVDHQDPKRYRRSAAFPGAEIDAVAGTTYGKAMLDLNLPPLRFERLGTPGFYGSWIRASVFGSGLVTNYDLVAQRRKLANAGAQLDLRVMLLNQQPFTLSVGWARAFERGARTTEEWMASLKIL